MRGNARWSLRGRVLAIEAAEGTDAMLARVAEMRQSGRLRYKGPAGVLVKTPKRGQDLRLDMPAIGPDTVAGAARAELARAGAGGRRGAHRRARALHSRGRRGGSVHRRIPGVNVERDRALRIALVAGEHSGDQLGFKLMRALSEACPAGVAFTGVGGEAMEAEGLKSLFPIGDIAVMGIAAGDRPPADAPQAHPADGGGDRRGTSGRARHHRQPRLHPPRRAKSAQGAARSADRRLRQPERLGLAAGTGEGDAAPMSTACSASCRSSPKPTSGSAARAASMSATR